MKGKKEEKGKLIGNNWDWQTCAIICQTELRMWLCFRQPDTIGKHVNLGVFTLSYPILSNAVGAVISRLVIVP
jgi:hypothetical protein